MLFNRKNKKNDDKNSILKAIFGLFAAYQLASFISIFMSLILLVSTVGGYYYLYHKDKDVTR